MGCCACLGKQAGFAKFNDMRGNHRQAGTSRQTESSMVRARCLCNVWRWSVRRSRLDLSDLVIKEEMNGFVVGAGMVHAVSPVWQEPPADFYPVAHLYSLTLSYC